MNPFDLSGKTALVTGANTGIGQGIAIGLAKAGANIVAVGRTPADQTQKCIETTGSRCVQIQADLSSTAGLDNMVSDAEAELGPIDILVNNAGTIKRNDALAFTEEDWDTVMDLNLKTLFFLSQCVAKRMVAQSRPGKIINIASMLSFQGGIRVASYTASKSGVAGLTKLLANEWATKRICVNAIAPGYIATNNTAALQADEKRNQEIVGRIPAGRWGQPEDLSGAAVFLASGASDYVHGTVLAVDGGWLAR
ncbi:2-dehydro-3-deoxy-D-gluconate 5-dehydrogenase KduD [Alteromonas sp. 14N.309.X.WAT.G.H12]|uniref:2-dehydro-3-deoxy-D-gluconate 5-dehydrogenase KduD n=1 Tax=Alteromonas sp. 14N.309.X.WAT.G.H12 TaxID=3120824 RepID=UPI002FD59398